LERVFKINKHKLDIIIKYIIFFNWKWPWFTIRHHLSFDRLMTPMALPFLSDRLNGVPFGKFNRAGMSPWCKPGAA
jgi:hypothetical protein